MFVVGIRLLRTRDFRVPSWIKELVQRHRRDTEATSRRSLRPSRIWHLCRRLRHTLQDGRAVRYLAGLRGGHGVSADDGHGGGPLSQAGAPWGNWRSDMHNISVIAASDKSFKKKLIITSGKRDAWPIFKPTVSPNNPPPSQYYVKNTFRISDEVRNLWIRPCFDIVKTLAYFERV